MMNVFDQHQVAIAKRTLRLNDVGVLVLGGMTKDQARAVLRDKAAWTDERIAKHEAD
jgi:hypothetical protein